jgi:hypothetical protein
MRIKGMKLFTALTILLLSLNLAFAEKLDIEVKDSYSPGDDVNFKIILYDDNNQKINGEINYKVENYYSDIFKDGSVQSGELISFKLPQDTQQKPWKITAFYKENEISRLFNVGELKEADIKLEGDTIIITNIGNVPYEKNILIYIGENDQTASVYLEVGQTKKIRLTAPQGTYDVRIIEGDNPETIEFKDVSLIGNAVGLQSVVSGKSLYRNYTVWIFLVSIAMLFIIVSVLRFAKKSGKRRVNKKKL